MVAPEKSAYLQVNSHFYYGPTALCGRKPST